jgi:hypothetical protein
MGPKYPPRDAPVLAGEQRQVFRTGKNGVLSSLHLLFVPHSILDHSLRDTGGKAAGSSQNSQIGDD